MDEAEKIGAHLQTSTSGQTVDSLNERQHKQCRTAKILCHRSNGERFADVTGERSTLVTCHPRRRASKHETRWTRPEEDLFNLHTRRNCQGCSLRQTCPTGARIDRSGSAGEAASTGLFLFRALRRRSRAPWIAPRSQSPFDTPRLASLSSNITTTLRRRVYRVTLTRWSSMLCAPVSSSTVTL